jgi:predicted nucleotide-binding protein
MKMQPRPRRIFVQFINPELLTLYGCKQSDAQLFAQAVRLARIALMVSEDGVVLPRSYLVEVGIIDAFLKYLRRASDAGLVQISSESPVGLEFLAKKRREYRTQIELFPGYSKDTSALDLDSSLWTPRTRSSSGEIGAAWSEELEDGGLWQEILAHGTRPHLDRPLARIENAIEAVPYRLDGRAFIFRYVSDLLPLALEAAQRVAIEMLISRAYLLSYMAEYEASILVDLPVGRFDCGLSEALDEDLAVSVRRLMQLLSLLGISSHLASGMSLQALLRLRVEPMWRWLMERHFEDITDPRRPLTGAMMAARFKALQPPQGKSVDAVVGRIAQLHRSLEDKLPTQLELGSEVQSPLLPEGPGGYRRRLDSSRSTMPLLPRDPNDIFLVQGRDADAVEGLKAVLRAAALRPIEWEEARSWTGEPTPYTLQVLEAAFRRVGAVVVLFTPDDSVRLREDLLAEGDPEYEREGGYQARPNVLVEAGMALALHRKRTVIVEIGKGMRPTTDLDGLNVVRFSGDAASRAKLIGRLKDCGCEPRGEEYLTVPGFGYLEVEEERA